MLFMFGVWKIVRREIVTVLMNCLVTVTNATLFLNRLIHYSHHTKNKRYILPGQHAIFKIILCNMPAACSFQLFETLLRQQIHVWVDTIDLTFLVILAKRTYKF